jgi:hypothetical protein
MKKIFILTSLIFVLVQTQVSAQGDFSSYSGGSSYFRVSESGVFTPVPYEVQTLQVVEKNVLLDEVVVNGTDLDVIISGGRIHVSAVYDNMFYEVYDLTSKLLLRVEIVETETLIPINNFSSHTLIVIVKRNGEVRGARTIIN